MKTIWIVLLTVIISGGVIGGGTYYLVNAKETKDKDSLQAQIDNLSVTLSQKQTELTNLTNTTTSGSTNSTASSETASWKTFTSTKFSIKYPSTWTAKDYPSSGDNEAGLYSTANQVKDASNVVQPNIIVAYSGSLDKFVTDNSNGSKKYTTLKAFLEETYSMTDAQIATHAVVANDITGYWIYTKDATTVFFPKDSSVYFVTFWDQKTYDQIAQEQKKILSTLIFTN